MLSWHQLSLRDKPSGIIPHVVVSDNANYFVSHLTKKIVSIFWDWNKKLPFSGYRLCERMMETIYKALHHVTASVDAHNIGTCICQKAVWPVRNAVNDTTGYLPFELLYGKVGRGLFVVVKK